MDKLELVSDHFSKDYKAAEDMLLQISIHYPQTLDHQDSTHAALNHCMRQTAENLAAALSQGMEQEARAALNMLPEALPYQVSGTYTATYNDHGILSFFTDVFLYAGGVRGITYRYGSSVRVRSGTPLFLTELFPAEVDAARAVVEFLTAQNPEIQSGIAAHFAPENIYFTEQGLAVFYQPHTIAPPAGGIPVFVMPYAEGGPFSPEVLGSLCG
ncbi:MAG: DUF3298 and DUF4163 domain-containing protein [Oscillospiraceae bacterium]|nr:DUF3298 and DUF4163 domain-containing protein [Oscillospiraceae bacterium]